MITTALATSTIPPTQRRHIVQSFNPHRNASSSTTPLQVGNGNFAFGADVTGLQTFGQFAIQSTTAWHNFSLPSTPGQTAPDGRLYSTFESDSLANMVLADFTGLDWWTHGRLVNYDMPNPDENDISNWLIQNPQRLSMANIGLYFGGNNVTEVSLLDKSQDLDLWEGTITSSFQYNGHNVSVQVWCHPSNPVLGIEIKSKLLSSGDLGVFFNFPYSDVNKFDAPYVGVWDTKATSNNTVDVQSAGSNTAFFKHAIDSNIVRLDAEWSTKKTSLSGPLAGTNKFVLTPSDSDTLQLVVSFPADDSTFKKNLPSYNSIASLSKTWWANYWTSGAFIDLSATDNANATELQRRIVLSQYLVAVNEASDNPPQGMFYVTQRIFAHWTMLIMCDRIRYDILESEDRITFIPLTLS